jgi:DNA repair exonuclease SbcCD ATPase subunit
MLVTVNFDKNGVNYKIERGRKPQVLRFFINEVEQNSGADGTEDNNEAQGENKETQEEINRLLGMTHAMFKNIIALNTYTQPFLATKQAEQREIIEQLLGITLLSEKAELLKEQMRVAKQELTEEKMRLDAVLVSNKKVEESIKTFELRSAAWQTQKNQDIAKFESAIEELERVDIQTELESHKRLAKHTDDSKTLRNLEKEKSYHEDSLTKATRQKEQTVKDLEYAEKATCPTCEQDLHGEKHQHLVYELRKDLEEQTQYEQTLSAKLKEIQNSIAAI